MRQLTRLEKRLVFILIVRVEPFKVLARCCIGQVAEE
jgi:hypothetical protein